MKLKIFSWQTLVIVVVNSVLLWSGWQYSVRKGIWPNNPRIVECRLRPATPLELWHGADVGVTTRAIVPIALVWPCPDLEFSYSKVSRNPTFGHQSTRAVCGDRNRQSNSDYMTMQEDVGLHLKSWKRPLIGEVSLRSSSGRFAAVIDKYELTTKGLTTPDLAASRRANFRVDHAVLYQDNDRHGMLEMVQVQLDVSQVTNDQPGLISRPQCVGKWRWQSVGDMHPTRAFIGSWDGAGANIVRVQLRFIFSRLHIPSSKTFKVSGLLSINNGWPQEITVEWPKKSSALSPESKTKFTTILAPLPLFG